MDVVLQRAERLGRWLFPSLSPFWQAFCTGWVIGSVMMILAVLVTQIVTTLA